MTTEKYLQRMKWLENMMLCRAERIDAGRSRATNMVAPTDKDVVQTSPKDTLCEILSNVADNDKELQGYKTEYLYIKSQIDSLTGVYSSAYLYMRFAKDKSVNETARTLNISRSTAYRVHKEALEEFEDLYGETYKKAKNYQNLEHFGTV